MVKEKKDLLKCVDCENDKDRDRSYYRSNNKMYRKIGRIPVCKECLAKKVNLEDMNTVYDVLRELDIVFDIEHWDAAVKSKASTLGKYMSMANSLPKLKGLGWDDSTFDKSALDDEAELTNESITPEDEEPEIDISGERNKQDVLRMLGYDPFEGESTNDKRHLYNKLVDMLDESTLEDGFKLPAVIEIVKGFNQLDKLNRALAIITEDATALSKNISGVKPLIDSKEKLLKSMLALAKDNGISVNHNNNKSKGAGTLSGIIKTLQEKGIEEGELNLFDIETAAGIKQVADLSNKSILEQLQFDENDYTTMLIEQREMIEKLDVKVEKLEEENRLLKKEIMGYKKNANN